MMFVIKNESGAFVEEHPSGKGLTFVRTDVEGAQHYTESQVRILHGRYRGTWREEGLEGFRVEYNLSPAKILGI